MAAQITPVTTTSAPFQVRDQLGTAQLAQLLLTQFDSQSPPKQVFLQEVATALGKDVEQVNIESLIDGLMDEERSELFAQAIHQALQKHHSELIDCTGQEVGAAAAAEADSIPLTPSQRKRRERGSSLSSRVLRLVDADSQDARLVQVENSELLRQLLDDLPYFPDSAIEKMYTSIPSKKKPKNAPIEEQRSLLADLLTKRSQSQKTGAQFFDLVNEVRAQVSSREQTAYELSFLLDSIKHPSCGNGADALDAVEYALGKQQDVISKHLHQFESKWLKKEEAKELLTSPEFHVKDCIGRIIALIEVFLKRRQDVSTDDALKNTFGDPIKEPNSLAAFLHKSRKHLMFCGAYRAQVYEEALEASDKSERDKVISDTSWLNADTFRACFGRLADSLESKYSERVVKVTLARMVSSAKQKEILALKGPQIRERVLAHQGRVVEALDLVGSIDAPKLETAKRAFSLYVATQRLRIETARLLAAIEGDTKIRIWLQILLPALEQWRESLALPFEIDPKTPYEQHLKLLTQFARELIKIRINPSIVEAKVGLLASLIRDRDEEDELRGQLRDRHIGSVHRCIEISRPEVFVLLLLGGKQLPDLSLLSSKQLWQMLDVLVDIKHIRGKKALRVIAQALSLKLQMQSAPHADDFCLPFEPPHWMDQELSEAGFFHRCSSNAADSAQIVEKKKCDAFLIESPAPADEEAALQVWNIVIIKNTAGILPNKSIIEHAKAIYIHPQEVGEVPQILSTLKEIRLDRCKNILIAAYGPQVSAEERELQPLSVSIEGYQLGNFSAQVPLLEGLFFPSVIVDISAVHWVVSSMKKCPRLKRICMGLDCQNPLTLPPETPNLFKEAFTRMTDVRLLMQPEKASGLLALGKVVAAIVATFPESLSLSTALFPPAYWQLVSKQLKHGDCQLQVGSFGKGDSPDLFGEEIAEAVEPIQYPALTLDHLPKDSFVGLPLLPPAILDCRGWQALTLERLDQLLAQGRSRALRLSCCGLKIEDPIGALLLQFCSNAVVTAGDFEWLASESEGLFNASDLKREHEVHAKKTVGDLYEMINEQAAIYGPLIEPDDFGRQSPKHLALLLAVLILVNPKKAVKIKKGSNLQGSDNAFRVQVVRKLFTYILRSHSSVKELNISGNELGAVPLELPSSAGLEEAGSGYIQVNASDEEEEDFGFGSDLVDFFGTQRTASFKRSSLGRGLLSKSIEDLSGSPGGESAAKAQEGDSFVDIPHIKGVPTEKLPWAYETGEGYLLALCMGQWPQIAKLNISECGGDPAQVLQACIELITKREYEDELLRDMGSNLKALAVGDSRWSLSMVERLLKHLEKTQINDFSMPHADPNVIACIEAWNIKQTKKDLSNQANSTKGHFAGEIHV